MKVVWTWTYFEEYRKGYWPNWRIEKPIKNGNELVKVKGKDKG